ncbi:MAG: CPBP family intramembrane metalloprotease [Cyclobacteriaceae bacterium]|nr:CPBP family intramembrane metalloprotease [Cyclobacteriaceae bacterium]
MNKLKTTIALLVVVVIPFGIMIWTRVHQSTGFAATELIVFPLLFGGSSLVLLVALKKYFLKEDLEDFNPIPGKWDHDIGWGLILTLLYFILFFLERATLTGVLQFNPNRELLGLILEMRDQPWLLILWFGPVLWIGIALYEELLRVFFLTSLWKWSQNTLWTISVIVLFSLMFGLAHWYQGSYGIVTIFIKSWVAGYFYYKHKRLMPLVYAHVLYDGLQVAALLLTTLNDQGWLDSNN